MNNFNLANARNFLLSEAKIVTPLNEMAHISGKLQAAIDSVIEAYPELDGLPLKKQIRGDQDVIDALDGSDLYDNQLNKYIALKKGRRELQQRGRKVQPKDGEEPINEMAKIGGALKDAIDAVIEANPDLNGLPLKKVIRGDEAVQTALGKDALHDNQLNRYIAVAKGDMTLGQRGRKPLDATRDAQTVSDIGQEYQELEKLNGFDEAEPIDMGSEEEDQDPLDTWNVLDDEDPLISDDEPKSIEIDSSFEDDVVSDPTANAHKNIITKKVSKIESAADDETYKREMAALKQFIQKPEVKKSLGTDLIRTLVSPIIG